MKKYVYKIKIKFSNAAIKTAKNAFSNAKPSFVKFQLYLNCINYVFYVIP